MGENFVLYMEIIKINLTSLYWGYPLRHSWHHVTLSTLLCHSWRNSIYPTKSLLTSLQTLQIPFLRTSLLMLYVLVVCFHSLKFKMHLAKKFDTHYFIVFTQYWQNIQKEENIIHHTCTCWLLVDASPFMNYHIHRGHFIKKILLFHIQKKKCWFGKWTVLPSKYSVKCLLPTFITRAACINSLKYKT